MEQKGTHEWLQDIAAEEPGAADMAAEGRRPDDAYIPEWAKPYWDAWYALRFDRQYGAMGGETPISFRAIDAYAIRYRIIGFRFETLRVMISAMDDEWLQHVARVAKEADDRRKQNPQT